MKKILVTGGAGYIGSHTVVELHNYGYQPVIVDDLSNSRESVLSGLEKIIGKMPLFYKIDIKNLDQLRKVFELHKIDAVTHFAASKAVGESVKEPIKYYKNNIGGTANLLELMDHFKVRELIFSSSCTVYGEPDELPVTEHSSIKKASSPYGNTKRICEELIEDQLKATKELKAISLRYFNPIGAHQSGLIGELPQGVPNNLMPFLLKVVSGELDCLSVFGNDYNTPDGTCIRDYIHVVDLAKAHVNALELLSEGGIQDKLKMYNIGTGMGYSVLELISSFEKATGKKVKYKVVGRREGDIEKIFADPSLAERDLKWKAELGLEEMMSSSWKWQQKM